LSRKIDLMRTTHSDMEAAKRSEDINEVGANFILFATDLNRRQQAMQSVIRTQSVIRNP
jgi:hypothetical protein